MSHEITTPSGSELFGHWLSDEDWQNADWDLESLIVGIQREAVAAAVERIRAALRHYFGESVTGDEAIAILDAEIERGTTQHNDSTREAR